MLKNEQYRLAIKKLKEFNKKHKDVDIPIDIEKTYDKFSLKNN